MNTSSRINTQFFQNVLFTAESNGYSNYSSPFPGNGDWSEEDFSPEELNEIYAAHERGSQAADEDFYNN